MIFVDRACSNVRARAFNAHYSAYRNVRFGFAGGLGQAFVIYALWPIAAVLSLGLLLPYIAYLNDRFFIENSYYGRAKMSFTGTPKAY